MADFNAMAKKWQARWSADQIFKSDLSGEKPKFYCLEMFPYPSAYGLHMGHARNFTMGDVIARYKRMSGFDVLYPMGYDAFGLPAENAAIKNKTHPKTYTDNAIAAISKQQIEMGNSYDWDRMIATCRPEYYKWNQWIFLQFYKRGLVYRKEAPINWCPKCATVLANEQVKDSKCWRCESIVEIKDLEQWFIRITEYADDLLDGLKGLTGWPEKIKIMQEHWIGRSTGTLIEFELVDKNDHAYAERISVFTTRPDTLMGVTFITFAPEHPLIAKLIKGNPKEAEIKEFINKVVISEKFTRAAEDKPKEGMFIDKYVIHPITKEKIPIYIANFVLMDYGTGCVMAVPAHDTRDYAFAKKHNLPIKQVIASNTDSTSVVNIAHEAYTGEGKLVHSGEFDGLDNVHAKKVITEKLHSLGHGKFTKQYKIRDWLISRQRYWGTPIPIVYCEHCGVVPVHESDLPILLPEDVQFTGEGNPLKTSSSFVNTHCPKCKAPARRETDTMDTFFDSSWYFLRFCSPHDSAQPFDTETVNRMLPVDQYIGGAEHAVMHLLYARFFTRVLHDMGLVHCKEPFTNLFNQGMVTKDGAKMSKSYGNVVSQDAIAEQFGIDTARLFLMFVSSPESELEWSDEGIQGSYRFLTKVFSLVENYVLSNNLTEFSGSKDAYIESKRNSCIRDVSAHLEAFRLNKMVLSIMEFANDLLKSTSDISRAQMASSIETLALLLAPLTPHIAEEMWEMLDNDGFITLANWPACDESKIDAKIEDDVVFIEETISNVRKNLQQKNISPNKIELFQAESWKYDFALAFKEVFALIKNPKDIAEAISNKISYNKEDVVKLAFSVYKNQKLLPLINRTMDEEGALLQEIVVRMKQEFNCEVILTVDVAQSADIKAKNGLPGKPSISIN